MKLYTFLDDNSKIIIQVMADNHDDAMTKAELATNIKITFNTDFYSEGI